MFMKIKQIHRIGHDVYENAASYLGLPSERCSRGLDSSLRSLLLTVFGELKSKSYERTQHLIENKGHELSEPNRLLKTSQLSPLTQ
jgi:hypothetical protein